MKKRFLIFTLQLVTALVFCACVFAQQPVTTSQVTMPLSVGIPFPPTPGGPPSVIGAGGSATYYYWLVAEFSVGNSALGGPFAVYDAPNTLSSGNYVFLGWNPVPGATTYDVLRTVTNSPPGGACNCAVVVGTSSTTVNDQSNSLNSYTVSTFQPQNFQLSLANESVGSNSTHLILRRQPGGAQLADLNTVGSGLGDPGSNGIVKRTSLNNTAIAGASDVTGLFSGCSGSLALLFNGTCGSAGGATNQINGINLSSQTTLNFDNPASFNGLTFTFTNPSSGNVLPVIGGALGNSGLANSSLSVSPTSGGGLSGGGSVALGGTTTLGLLTTCSSNQLLQWNGSAWVCATIGGALPSGSQGLALLNTTGSNAYSAANPFEYHAEWFCSGGYSIGKCVSGNAFDAINLAAIAAAPTSGVVNAQGFYGEQEVSAASLTTALMPLNGVGGEVKMPQALFDVDGPASSLTASSNYSFNDGGKCDGASTGTCPGTPGLLIPERTKLTGIGTRPDGQYGTVFRACTPTLVSAGKCTQAFPQRRYTITTTSCTGSPGKSCVINVTPATAQSCGSAANCAPNSGVAISAFDCSGHGALAWIQGADNVLHDYAGGITACGATSVTITPAVPDASGYTAAAMTCSSGTCGFLYIETPILAPVNGDCELTGVGCAGTPTPYVQSASATNSVCYGCSASSIAMDGGSWEGVVGLEDKFAEERASYDHLGFSNLPWGYIVRTQYAQNGGGFDFFEHTGAAFPGCEGHGYAWIQQAGALRGFRGATFNDQNGCVDTNVSGSPTAYPNACMVVDSQGVDIDTNYLSGCVDGVLIGTQFAAHDLNIKNGYCGATGAGTNITCSNYGVEISNANTSADITVEGFSMQPPLSSDWAAAFANNITGHTSGTDKQIGSCHFDKNGSLVSEICTATNFPLTAGGGLQAPVINATTGFQIGGAAPSNHIPCGNGTNYVDSTPAGCGITGSGNTTSTSLTSNTISKANGANSIVNSLLTDNGTTAAYSGTGGISASAGPVSSTGPSGDAGLFALVGNTTNQTCPANEFCIFGFNSASATTYGWQPSTTAPSGTEFVMAGTPSSGASPVTYQASVALNQLATQAADTAVINMTAGTAAPTAVAIPTTAHGIWLGEGTATAPGITAAGALGTVLAGQGGSSDPAFQTMSAINPQTATYQVLASDFQGYKNITVPSGTFTVTLVASGSQPAAGQYVWVTNYGSGVVTIARSGQNINGGTTSLSLAAGSATAPTAAQIWSDGTNYFAQTFGSSSGGSGTVTSVTFTGDGVVDSSTPSTAVTSSGTVLATAISQSPGSLLAGPAPTPGASSAAPSFVKQTSASAILPYYIADPVNTIWLNDNFVSGGTTCDGSASAQVGGLPFFCNSAGGTWTYVDGVGAQCAVAATTNDQCDISTRQNIVNLATQTFDLKFRVNISAITNVVFYGGFWQSGNARQSGIRFSTTAADTNWMFVTNNGTVNAVSSGVAPVAGTAVDFRIRSTTAGTLLFSINGGAETSVSTDVPNALNGLYFTVTTTTTQANNFQIYYSSLVVNNLSR